MKTKGTNHRVDAPNAPRSQHGCPANISDSQGFTAEALQRSNYRFSDLIPADLPLVFSLYMGHCPAFIAAVALFL